MGLTSHFETYIQGSSSVFEIEIPVWNAKNSMTLDYQIFDI